MSGWELEGRRDEVARARAALLEGRSVLLIGAAGVGKTRLAAEVADQLPAELVEVAAVVGSVAGADLPFAAIAPLLAAEAVDGGLPLLIGLRRTLADRAAGRRLVLQVDDAQHLDAASALIVHQLVDLGEATLLVTQRRGTTLPEPIARTLHDQPFARIDLEPLDPAGTAALGARIVGSDLDAATAQRLWDLTEGNPLFVREVLLAAGDAGTGPDLGGRAVGSPRLVDLVDRRLADLAPEARQGLLHLALGEPLGPGELDRVLAPGVLDDLEAAQLVASHLDDRRLVVRLAHPLYGEVLRASASPTQLRTVHRRLAEALQATGARRRGDVARLATWALDGNLEIDGSVLVQAARAAALANDHAGTIRLSRAALERTGDFAVGEALFDALYAQGDPDAIDAHLEAWGAVATDPDQQVAVALARGISTFWRRGDLARAAAALEEAARNEASSRREEAIGQHATLVAFTGDAATALAMARPLLDRSADRVLIHAALAASQALRSSLRPEEALEVIHDAVEAYTVLGPQILLIPKLVLTGARACALADAGRLEEAVGVARKGQERARATGDQGSLALATLGEATALLPMGRPASMVEALAVPEQVFVASNHWAMHAWVLALLALGRATMGDAEGARAHLAALDELPVGPAQVFRSGEVRARAWVAWLDGRPEDAQQLLRAGAEACAAGGDLMGEAACLYDLARLDRPEEVADRLDELAVQADGALWPALAAHVRARVGGNPTALGAAADALAALGTWLWAAEAAHTTADAHRRAGAQREATAWAHRADEWRGRCEVVRSPGLVATSGPDPLSRREREVAILAAQGLPSRVIGERLFVGTRTVESHLARVYTKLGIRSRAELARLLDGGQADLTSDGTVVA